MFFDPDECTIEDERKAVEALAAEGIHPPSSAGTTPYW
jgi:hypothetical protein